MMQTNAAHNPLAQLRSASGLPVKSGHSLVWPALASAVMALVAYAVTLYGTLVYDDLILRIDPRYATPAYWKYFWFKQ